VPPDLPAPAAPAWETGWSVRSALQELPEAYRAAMILHYLHGFTTAEIASLLAVPQGTVLSRLHQGRRRMKEMLADAFPGRTEVDDYVEPE
jgi:RNA polymerase sigma-70 factor (ECF subfamily)